MKNTFSGSLAALVANIIFGFSFLFSKIALQVADPLIILAVRFTVAFLILTVLWLTGMVKMQFKGKPK
jgi:drug/metabolite transporter (DMT)-like permease